MPKCQAGPGCVLLRAALGITPAVLPWCQVASSWKRFKDWPLLLCWGPKKGGKEGKREGALGGSGLQSSPSWRSGAGEVKLPQGYKLDRVCSV